MCGSVEPSPAALIRAAFRWVRIPHIGKIKTRYPDGYLVFMAEDEGFEPPQTESESGVLPLHKSSIRLAHISLYARRGKSQALFAKVSEIFPGKLILPGKINNIHHCAFGSSTAKLCDPRRICPAAMLALPKAYTISYASSSGSASSSVPGLTASSSLPRL